MTLPSTCTTSHRAFLFSAFLGFSLFLVRTCGAQEIARNETKDFKICNILGGLDVTRFVSTRARSFFASAIDDVEMSREFLAEVVSSRESYGDFETLEAMSATLNHTLRGLPENDNSTTVDAGLGYADDRPDRRMERFMSLSDFPLVGDKKSDFDMLDSFTTLFPWLLDRKSKPENWWVDHINGQSQGENKEAFEFGSLYQAVWSVSWGGGCTYYPPFTSFGIALGDVLGNTYSSREEAFVVPTLPENNPGRIALFTKPYPDTAVPGLSLITAAAPIYYTGSFHGYSYNDTFIGTTGVDIAVSSVSSYLDVLQDSLTEHSFGMLVDSEFNTIVISQAVVSRIYPERTGFEETRVTYDTDGSTIVQDRRNQPYLPSDTILQDLTKLDNADWSGLLDSVLEVSRGDRGYLAINITQTGDDTDTPFYVMFERWKYVADWSLLVFAPKAEVEQAIEVSLYSGSPGKNESKASMTGEQGTALEGQATLKNDGSLDVLVSAKGIPRWIKLDEELTPGDTFTLNSGEEKSINFEVSTSAFDVGTQASAIVFSIQDANYPDCFFSEDLSLPLSIVVLAKECGDHKVASAEGTCVCDSSSVEIGGSCLANSWFITIVLLGFVTLGFVIFYLYMMKKRRVEDSHLKITPSELTFASPPQSIGEGSFGVVLLAEYRGTQVAVKRLRSAKAGKRKPESASRSSNFTKQWGTASIDDVVDLEAAKPFSKIQSKSPGLATSSDVSGPSSEFSVVSDLEVVKTRESQLSQLSVLSMLGVKMKSSGKSTKKRFLCTKKASDDLVDEIRFLSKLRHPCIIAVMGAVLENKHEPMLVMEYMENGSLYDLIRNETMDFEGDLMLSILKDVISGVQFLHSSEPGLVHGDLKTPNILVDSRFRAKVADFGLSVKKARFAGTPYWMAPEVLRGDSAMTTASDVYAIGMILYEIYSRKDPYQGEDPSVVISGIMDPMIGKRPPVPKAMTPKISAIMSDCFVETAVERPAIDEISSRIKRYGPEDVEPVGLIKKKAGEKNLDVLLKMFPRHIAEALRDGRKIEPEHHDSVTIFFSDIVGFTTLSSELPPQKISDMLQRLFESFDSLSDKHGVHKLETIGDAWMGVTNCVCDQSLDHVKRVAEFSLDAIQAAGRTLVDLEDEDRGLIEIRIGFHTGPVLSNVIGTTQPRYSLFGDTVNTAARMESNSRPGRIQCSDHTADLLRQQAPHIRIEPRGSIPIKGKGEMRTHWIRGRKSDNYVREESKKDVLVAEDIDC